MTLALYVVLGYALGSIPFSYLVPRLLGKIDIRHHGSGNTGTTNVVRTLGLKVGAIAFLGDFSKGLVAALLGLSAYGVPGAWLIGGISVLGHCYSPFLYFKGGKGIATSAGILAVIVPEIFAILLVWQFLIIFISRYMSLASITSAVLLPILAWIFNKPESTVVAATLYAAFVIFKHKANIKRLLSGTENKLKK